MFQSFATFQIVRFAWDCNQLESFVLLNKSEKKNEYDEYNLTSVGKPHVQKVQCPQLGRRQVTIDARTDGTIVFSDGTCQELVVPSPFDLDEELYVTIGASPHVDTIQAKIYSFQVYGPPSNVNPVTKDNLHDAFTRYEGSPDPDMWTLDLLRGGTVRDNCGSAKEKNTPVQEQVAVTKKSLYFGGLNGQRFATTSQFDFSNGGTIEFWMRMGYQKRATMMEAQESALKEESNAAAPSSSSLLEVEVNDHAMTTYVGEPGDNKGCAYMYDNDGVVVQYTVEGSPYATDSYQKLWRLPGAYFGRQMRPKWRKIRIKVDKYHNNELMKSPGVVLRWKQLLPGLTSPRGDWSIDMVEIKGEPAPILKPVIVKSFCGDLSTKWDIPAALQEPEGYGEEGEEGEGYGEGAEGAEGPVGFQMMTLPEDCRVEFTGKAQGKALPRAKRMFAVRPGVRITAVVDKTHECSDHMIVLSSNRNYRWNWGSEAKTVKFGWNCDHKVMYTAGGEKVVDCKKRGIYKLQIDVTSDKVRFKDDGGCQDMEMEFGTSGASEDDPLYLFFGADQDFAPDPIAKESYSSFENFTVSLYPETSETRMNHTILADDFNKEEMVSWSLPPPGENAAVEDGDLEYTTEFNRIERNGTMNIYGPSEGARVLRTQKSFTLPFNFSADLNSGKNDDGAGCPSQFVVVTPRKNYHYSKMGGKSTITVGWDCKSKWIISGTDNKNKVTTPCTNDGNRNIHVSLVVRGAMVQFKDDLNCRTLYAPNPIKKKRRPLYLYIGASGGTKSSPSRFSKVTLLGRKPVTGLVSGDSTLLVDDYNFRCQEDKTMWSSIVGGRVDYDCGSISGCSLHMGKDGERSVSTKVVDVSHGAKINFGLRFGGGNHQTMDVHCVGLNPADPAEFVELQWKTTEKTKKEKWSTLSRYTAKDFHEMLTNFSSLTVRIEKDSVVASAGRRALDIADSKEEVEEQDPLSDPLPKGVIFRWIQNPEKKHRVCCGHWALDNVEIARLPPAAETILQDDMLTLSPRLWNAPKEWTEADAKKEKATPQKKDFVPPKHGVGENGVWFSGDYAGRVPMRTKVTVPYPDFVFTATINRPKQCSNHFVVLTSNPAFTWEWGQPTSNDAVILAFNCDDKYIYSPTLSTPPSGSPNSKCTFQGTIRLSIEMTSESIIFADDRCGEVEVSGSPIGVTGPLYVYLGASQDQKGKSSFREIDIRTKMPEVPIVQEMSDRFVKLAKTQQMWRTPSKKTMGKSWGMMVSSSSSSSSTSTKKSSPNDGKAGGLWFAYNPHATTFKKETRVEMRTRGTFPGWATSAMIGIKKNAQCNSHYIVLTTNPDYVFSWGVEGNGEMKSGVHVQKIATNNNNNNEQFTTVIMGWNCDDKVVYNSKAPRNAPTVPYASSPCAALGDYTVSINLDMWELAFDDNRCKPMVVKPNPFQSSDKLYVVVGADNDVLKTKSIFEYVNLKVRDAPSPWSKPIVMQDRFDFHGDLDRRIWKLKDERSNKITTTARVDNLCGDLPTDVSGSPTTALHFGSLVQGVNDVATTLPLDMQYGSEISFLLTFGWDGKTKIHDEENKQESDLDDDEDEPPTDLTSCVGFTNENDGMEVQYSVDSGQTWTTLKQYTMKSDGIRGLKLLNRFVNVSVTVDYDTAPLAMTDHTMLRLHQLLPSKNGAATGHWAISSLTLTSEPKPLLPTLEKDVAIEDDFETDDKFATQRAQWDMFETTGRPKEDQEEKTDGVVVLTFGGDPKKEASLTTTALDVRVSSSSSSSSQESGADASPGATLEIQLKRNSNKKLKIEGISGGAFIRFQYRLNDTQNEWKDLSLIGDAPETSSYGYSYSPDDGRTQTMKSYWIDSIDEYQTYLLQANADDMRADLDPTNSVWKTAQFRLYQRANATSSWSIDSAAVYVGAKRKGLAIPQLGEGKISRDLCYPSTETVAPYAYEFGKSVSQAEDNKKQTMLRFSGPLLGSSTVRTRKSFRAPSTVQIQGEIDGDCSNHVVILSTDKYYKYDAEPHPDAIRFVYDCRTKMIIGGTKVTSKRGKCPAFDRRTPPVRPNATELELPKPSNSSLKILRSSFPKLSATEAEEILMIHANNPMRAAAKVNENYNRLPEYLVSVRRKLHPPAPPAAKLGYPEPRIFNFTIQVETDRVKFVDSLGCDDLEVHFPKGRDLMLGANGTVATAKDFYVYIGAVRSDDDKKKVRESATRSQEEQGGEAEQQKTDSTDSAANVMDRYKGKPRVTSSGFASMNIEGPGSVFNLHNGSAPCPQMNDCEVAPWGNWSNCSIPCGYGGFYERLREITRPSKLGGDECPALFEREPCITRPCDCVVSNWTNWTRCGGYSGAEQQTACGGGTKRRRRAIELQPLLKHNGKACPVLEEIEKCPVHGLPCVEEIVPTELDTNDNVTKKRVQQNISRFNTFKEDESENWCLPPAFKIFPQSMWTNPEENVTAQQTVNNENTKNTTVVVGGGLNFKGSGVDKPATRTRWAVYTNDDLTIEADIHKLIEDPVQDPIGCANHFVAITTQRFYTFTWEEEPDAIKFVYNCSQKVIVGKDSTVQDERKCFPLPPPIIAADDLLPPSRRRNDTNVTTTNVTTNASSNSTSTNNNTRTLATDFLEIDGDEENTDPKSTKVFSSKPSLPLACTEKIKGKKDLQQFRPPRWCYDFSGARGKTLCEKGYVTKIGQEGEHWGKKRISHCKFNNEDMTCARGEWIDCEQVLQIEEEKYEEPPVADPKLDDIDLKTTMKLFIGFERVLFSDDTPCGPSPLMLEKTGFDPTEKLFVFIGSAAPFEPYTVTLSAADNVTKVVSYTNPKAVLPTTASFDRIVIEGSLSAQNRLKGTESALKLTDCQVSSWTPWDNCTALCEGGTKTRTRNVTAQQQDGGAACPKLTQTTTCNERTCDCTVTNFTKWTDCPVKCDGGLSLRLRTVVLSPLEDGQMCPHLNESKPCNEMPCAIEGLPFGGEEDEVAVENMDKEIENDQKVKDQKEVTDLAEKDAQNSDVKKDYYMKEAEAAEKVANDTVNTLDVEEAKSHAQSLRREADEAVEDAQQAWDDNEDASEELDNLREEVRARLEAGKATGVTKVLLSEASFDEFKVKDDHTWCYQKSATIAPYSYGWSRQDLLLEEEEEEEETKKEQKGRRLLLVSNGTAVGGVNGVNGTNGTRGGGAGEASDADASTGPTHGGMWFSGENVERPTVRSRRSFQLPLRIDTTIDLSYGSNQYIVLTDEKWFTWSSDPAIESEEKTIKFAYNGYEKVIVTPLKTYKVQCGNGYRLQKDTKKCFAKNKEDIKATKQCSRKHSKPQCKSIFSNNRRACQWRLDCPTGVESVWDNKLKDYRCNYSLNKLKNVHVVIELQKDGSMIFHDDSGGCEDVLIPAERLEQQGSDVPYAQGPEGTPGKDMFLYVGAARTKKSHFGGVTGKSIIHSIRVSGNGSNINRHNGTKACPARTDCQVSPWGLWSKCTSVCGGGSHNRKRTVTQAPLYGGGECPSLSEKNQPCNTQDCGANCRVTGWEPWNECSRVCSDREFPKGGVQMRRRAIFQEKRLGSHYGLDECPNLNETRFCNTQYCGRNCIVSQWTPWSNCSQLCGGGATQRFRNVQHHPEKGSHLGHDDCPPVHEIQPCNTQACPRTPKEPTPKLDGGKCSQYSQKTKNQRPLWDKRNRPHFRGVGNAAANTGTCSACVADPECGFCPNSGICMEGTPNGPTPKWNIEEGTTIPSFTSEEDMEKIFMYEANCSSYQYAECLPEPCREHADCSKCLADPYCGWCGMTGRCEEGNQAGSVGEYCPNGWIGSPLHGAWGSLRQGGGIGLKGKDDEEGEEGEDDEDDNDVWLESATQQLAILQKLPEICASDVRESETLIRQKLQEEESRQKLLRSTRESCAPCNGTWPYCDCGGNKPVNATPVLKFHHVVRSRDEAVGPADFTLPRKDAISDVWDHGRPRKNAGQTCMESKECTSDSCVRTRGDLTLAGSVCCHAQLRHCSGHGECVAEGTKCRCDDNYRGDDCSEQIVLPPSSAKNAEVDPLDKFGSLLGNLDDESWMEHA